MSNSIQEHTMQLSIITINYNNAEGLRKTLASVAAQTYPNIEHIIVDGGSTDGSVDVIREYESTLASSLSPLASRLKWLSEPDKGIYNAMNKGIEIALGKRVVNDDHTSSPLASSLSPLASKEYIQILNSGDILAAPDVTAKMVNHLTQFGETIGILYGNMIKEYPNGKRLNDNCLGSEKSKVTSLSIKRVEWTMYDFIKGTINHDPTYIHSSLYEKYGLYDDSLKIVSDWKWFVQSVVVGGENVHYVPMNVTIFDMTGISETNLKFREDERRQELDKMFPKAIMSDYYNYHFPLTQYKRLKKHKVWKLVYFLERILFKLEKWKILK